MPDNTYSSTMKAVEDCSVKDIQQLLTWKCRDYCNLILDMTILALIWYFLPRPIFITILVGELGGPKPHHGNAEI